MDADKAIDLSDQLDDRIIWLTLALSVAFFAVVNEVLRWVSGRWSMLQMLSQWRSRNLAVSWIHADICAVWFFYCYFMYVERLESFSHLLDFRAPAAYLLVSFSVGYFVYDFCDYVRERKTVEAWEVLLHHLTVLWSFGYNLYYHISIAFSVMALMVEVNSVFMHARKLLQMAGVPFSHQLYRSIVALNLASFAVFRGGAMVLIWVGLVVCAHRLSTVYLVGVGTIMVFMVVLNSVLFWRLVRSDILRELGRRDKRKGKESSGKTLANGVDDAMTSKERNGFSACSHNGREVIVIGKNSSDDGKVANGMVSRKKRMKGREVSEQNGDFCWQGQGSGIRGP